ncbi:MAG: hypothetical protein WBD05_10480 [Phycisphaerae bacterium]
MRKRVVKRVSWPESELLQLDDGTCEDPGIDIRVLANRSEAFRWAGDVVVKLAFSEGPDTLNANEHLRQIGLGSCKYPDLPFAVGNLYRHQIELLLKVIIVLGCRLIGRESNFPQTHDLGELWDEAKPAIEGNGVQAKALTVDKAGTRIAELAEIEHGTTEFRYPADSVGWDSPLSGMEDLRKLVAPLGEYLSECALNLWRQRRDQRTR